MYYYNSQLINILKEVHLPLNYYNSKIKELMMQFICISNKEMYHKIQSQALSHHLKAIKIFFIKINQLVSLVHDQLKKGAYQTHLKLNQTSYTHHNCHFYLSGLNVHRDEKLLSNLEIYFVL